MKLKRAHPDRPLSYCVDSSLLECTRWVGVVLRNLPPGSVADKICIN